MNAMDVSKALEFADEWTKGYTFYTGAEGWRIVCATLAAEVRRLRPEMSDKLPMTREQIAEELAKCFPECLSANGKHRIAIFAEHILRIGTTELREENKRLRGDHIACHQGRDIIDSLAQAMHELPCCGIMGILAAAMQEIDALRNVIAEGETEEEHF